MTKTTKALPTGMRRKGNAYYAWRWVPHRHDASCEPRCELQSREDWVALGSDFPEARRRLGEFRREAAPVALQPGTVAEAVEWWLTRRVARRRNAKGLALARQRAKQYLVPFFGKKVLRRIGKGDLEAYALWVGAQPWRGREPGKDAAWRGLSVLTQRHVLSDAACFFRWAARRRFVAEAPIPEEWLPAVPARLPARLSDDEAARCMAMPAPWGLVARVALATGLRWSELVRVEARHVERGLLELERTKNYRLRRVPLPPALVAELRGHVGRIVPDVTYNRAVRKIRSLSGIPTLRPHQWRHTFACRWLEAGGSLASLKEILGHRDVATTQIYGSLAEGAVAAEAAVVFEKLVEKGARSSG